MFCGSFALIREHLCVCVSDTGVLSEIWPTCKLIANCWQVWKLFKVLPLIIFAIYPFMFICTNLIHQSTVQRHSKLPSNKIVSLRIVDQFILGGFAKYAVLEGQV